MLWFQHFVFWIFIDEAMVQFDSAGIPTYSSTLTVTKKTQTALICDSKQRVTVIYELQPCTVMKSRPSSCCLPYFILPSAGMFFAEHPLKMNRHKSTFKWHQNALSEAPASTHNSFLILDWGRGTKIHPIKSNNIKVKWIVSQMFFSGTVFSCSKTGLNKFCFHAANG